MPANRSKINPNEGLIQGFTSLTFEITPKALLNCAKMRRDAEKIKY